MEPLTIVIQMRNSMISHLMLMSFVTMFGIVANAQSAADDPSPNGLSAVEVSNTPAPAANNEESNTIADEAIIKQQNVDDLEADGASLSTPGDATDSILNVEAEADLPEGSLFGIDLTGITILDVKPRGPNVEQPEDGRVLLPNQLLFDPEEHNGVVLRLLDKVTTQIATETVLVGSQINFGTLRLSVDACLENPSTQTPEAAGYFRVTETLGNQAPIPRFSGWMFASSPALNALDHAIYDLWVMDCVMIEVAAADGEAVLFSDETPADAVVLSDEDDASRL